MKKLAFLALISLVGWGQQIDWVKQVKNKTVVDVRDYGAKCDGTTDDAAAIQAAFNSVTGDSKRRFIELCQAPSVVKSPISVYNTLDLAFGSSAGMARLIWRGTTPTDSVFVLKNSKQFVVS